jgi:hypothetical protein
MALFDWVEQAGLYHLFWSYARYAWACVGFGSIIFGVVLLNDFRNLKNYGVIGDQKMSIATKSASSIIDREVSPPHILEANVTQSSNNTKVASPSSSPTQTSFLELKNKLLNLERKFSDSEKMLSSIRNDITNLKKM